MLEDIAQHAICREAHHIILPQGIDYEGIRRSDIRNSQAAIIEAHRVFKVVLGWCTDKGHDGPRYMLVLFAVLRHRR
jgi:hypothetical protein